MSYGRYVVRILNRQNQPMHESWLDLRPKWMSWSAIGGCDEAVLSLEGSWMRIEDWQGYLGNPVEIYDKLGRLLWWGWLEQACQTLPVMQLSYDLNRMANRVAVTYRSLEPGSAFGETQHTDWVDDAESQALYGVKEHLIMAGALSVAQAEHWRDMALKCSRLPSLALKPQPGASLPGIRLHCKGWAHRLNWRIWQRESGVIGNAVVQSGFLALGAQGDNAKIGQSFKVIRDVQLSDVRLRVRKNGEPNDFLRVDIRADLNGAPGSNILSSCTIDTSSLSPVAYAWVTGVFSPQIDLIADKSYWFVITRSGSPYSGAHYVLGLDENLNYADGQMKVYEPASQSWVLREPMADMLFKLKCLTRVEDEINAMLVLAGDFLTGSALEASLGLRLPAVAIAGEPLLKALKRFLALGTGTHQSLLMDISANRFLRIFVEPGSDELLYTMDKEGRFFDRLGNKLSVLSELIGKRVRARANASFLVSGLRLDAEKGEYKIETR